MGFDSPQALRAVLLAAMTVDQLRRTGQNDYGIRYEAIVSIAGPSGAVRQIRTGWIVLFGEDTARFVTAYPAD